jgi:hypothetical protein
MLEKGTNRGQVSPIAGNGSFSFTGIDLNKKHTFLLFSSDFQLSSVLALKVNQGAVVNQYFSTKVTVLPFVVVDGPLLSFGGNSDSVTIDDSPVTDTNVNGIPDGMDSLFALSDLAYDRDKDGIADTIDIDDDADGTLDYWDFDSNGNAIPDALEKTHDQYGSVISYQAITIEKDITSATNTDYYINFIVAGGSTIKIDTITVIAPLTLISKAVSQDTANSNAAWDAKLLDGGANFDMGAGDGIFGARIKIPAAGLPRRYQSYIYRVNFAAASECPARSLDFPISFPSATLGDFNFTLAGDILTKSGSPLGEKIAYYWSVQVLTNENALVFNSPPLLNTVETYTLPKANLPKANNLKVRIVASSAQRITAYPAFRVYSIPQVLDLTL